MKLPLYFFRFIQRTLFAYNLINKLIRLWLNFCICFWYFNILYVRIYLL